MTGRLDSPEVALEYAYREGGQVTTTVIRDLERNVAEMSAEALKTTPGFISARILTGSDIPPAPSALTMAPPELAYSPGQKRDSVGRFGSGGGGGSSAAPAPAARGEMSNDEAVAALGAIGVDAGGPLSLQDMHPALRGEVVSAFENAHAKSPKLFDAMSIKVMAVDSHRRYMASTTALTRDYPPSRPGELNKGSAEIHFDSKSFGDPATFKAEMARHRQTDFMGGDDVDWIVQHELGHVFDGSLGHDSTDGGSGSYAVATRQRGTPLSGYAKTNPEERFGEEYAAVMTGKSTNGTESGKVMERLVKDNL